MHNNIVLCARKRLVYTSLSSWFQFSLVQVWKSGHSSGSARLYTKMSPVVDLHNNSNNKFDFTVHTFVRWFATILHWHVTIIGEHTRITFVGHTTNWIVIERASSWTGLCIVRRAFVWWLRHGSSHHDNSLKFKDYLINTIKRYIDAYRQSYLLKINTAEFMLVIGFCSVCSMFHCTKESNHLYWMIATEFASLLYVHRNRALVRVAVATHL